VEDAEKKKRGRGRKESTRRRIARRTKIRNRRSK
jgi:hypothetical protein